jgi:hypothetical protein
MRLTGFVNSAWIGAGNLLAEQHLGVGLALGFDHLRFLLSPRPRQPQAFSRGQFLFAMVCSQAARDLHAPAPESVMTDVLVVLRVCGIEGLPDDSQREARLCHNLLTASLPEGTAWDCADLNWGVIECEVLGCFNAPDEGQERPQFSSNLPIDHPAVCLHLYQPDEQVMEMLTNGTVDKAGQVELGVLRSAEDLGYRRAMHPACVSMADLRGKRTAMFGKTRLGKSNVVKLVAQGMLDASADNADLGQIIFDVNGEYANTNPQDGDTALAHVYRTRCLTYFLTDLKGNPDARLLRFNFYQRAEEALEVMQEMLPEDVSASAELRNLFVCRVPRLERLSHENDIEFRRKARKLMFFWALLHAIGCEYDSEQTKEWLLGCGLSQPFNPGFSQALRSAAYLEVMNKPAPTVPFDFPSMLLEMRTVARFTHLFRNDPNLSPHGHYIFDVDEEMMIALLCGNGHALELLRPCILYHSPRATHFTRDILDALQAGKTVIVNLSSASNRILRYFAQSICTSIFHEQERKFVSNSLANHYVQVYFEEAHNIFPPLSSTSLSIYSRFAKEGAKFHIGIVYCTQSPSTINRDLLAQTENFFIGHLSSSTDAACLAEVQVAFAGCEPQILRNRTPGFVQMLTFSHRYVVPVQAHRYTGESRLLSDLQGRWLSVNRSQ